MELKARYKLSYTLNKELKELTFDVELRMIEGLPKEFQNIWGGYATLNGKPYEEEDLSHCVNAKTTVERIGHKLRDQIKSDAKRDGKSFRVKNEEIKI